jgi:hypothetical protein
MNFVHGDRTKAEADVRAKINDIDKRMAEIRSMASAAGGN